MRTYCVAWGGKECAICCRICTKLTLNICIFIPIYSAFVLSQFSHVQLSVTLWTVAHQVPLSMGFSRQVLEWVAILSSRGTSQPRDQTCVSYISCIDRGILYHYLHLR